MDLGNGIRLIGRIDLVRRLDTGEMLIVDPKSMRDLQAESLRGARDDKDLGRSSGPRGGCPGRCCGGTQGKRT